MNGRRVLSFCLSLFALGAVAVVGCGSTTDPVIPPPPPPPPPPTSAQMTLETSLDNPGSVASPAVGASGGVISTTPANDFVPARVGDGLRMDAIAERVSFPQVSGGVQNIENERGTIELWYQPFYDHDDGSKYTILGTGTWKSGVTTVGIHLGKHNGSNQNGIFLILYDGNGVRSEHNVAATSYGWNAGEWQLIRLTWDMNVAAGERNLHLYLNGQELPLTGEVSRGPQPAPAESASELIYVGSRDLTGSIIPSGIHDEFRIWDQAIPPS